MKKLAVILAALLACTAAFAKPAYNGDLQVHTGVAFDQFEFSMIGNSSKMEAILFNIDAQSWNLFELNDLISVGFMVGTDFGWGGVSKLITPAYTTTNSDYLKDAFHWNIIAAPAVAFSFKPVKIQCSLGFDLGIAPGTGIELAGEKFFYSFPVTFGVVTEVQAKFFPDKKFSPLVGFRWSCTGSGRVKAYDRTTKVSTEQNTDKGFLTSEVFYIGASFNW